MATATITPPAEPIIDLKPKTPLKKEKKKRDERKSKRVEKKTKIPPNSRRPRWARIVKTAGINTNDSQTIVRGQGDQYLYISMIAFTCNDEGDITLLAGEGEISGPMSFGGTDEPRGAVIDHSRSPIMLDPGRSFGIRVTPAAGKTPQVAGYVIYYTLPNPTED